MLLFFLRNRDFQEVTLERDGETLLQFAAVYGFRNIQTLVHRMRKGRVPYQLVEVLSCPGGDPTTTNMIFINNKQYLFVLKLNPASPTTLLEILPFMSTQGA